MLEILRAVVQEKPVPPLQRNGGKMLQCGGRLEEIALKCLEKEKDRRYRTAEEVAQELDKVLKMLDTQVARVRGPVRGRMAIPHLDEQQRRLDAEMGVFNIEGARRGYREIAASTEDSQVRMWVDSCLVEVEAVEGLKRKMVERMNAARPLLPRLELLEKAIENAEILKVTEKKLVLFVNEKAIEVTWIAIRPSQILALAQMCDLATPQDRLSVAIYCMKAGLLAEAKLEFTGVLGTELEESAKQYLASLG